VGITVDIFGAICRAIFLSLKFTCFIIILRSLVKDFHTEVKIKPLNHQLAHEFKYGTSTCHESKASQLAQKDLPLFPLHKNVRHYFHFTKRFAVIKRGYRYYLLYLGIHQVIIFFLLNEFRALRFNDFIG